MCPLSGWSRRLIEAGIFALLQLTAAGGSVSAERLNGFNIIVAPGHPFGSTSAAVALARAKRIGATAIAIVPFLWQSTPSSSVIVRGADMSDEELRASIRQAHNAGLAIIVKPHVWVPQSWAGAVAPISEGGWQEWFAGYRKVITNIGQIAAEEHADILAIGTELAQTTHRPEWLDVIAAARAAFAGTLTYFAHNTEEAERVPFWAQLDIVGVTLYPSLGSDQDRAGRLATMREVADKLDALAAASGKHVFVGEVGLRSAAEAAAKPWESAEERDSAPDPLLQAEILGDWISILDRPAIRGVLVWRWFTDPDAGGLIDTDFTVQGKPAEGVLLCAWRLRCARQ
jgi:glycosyl hydrolase family 113